MVVGCFAFVISCFFDVGWLMIALYGLVSDFVWFIV